MRWQSAEAAMSSCHANFAGLQKTILCVDDDPLILASWSELIGSAGYRVLTARGGAEAIRQFSIHVIHAVVLDYEMPGLNGSTVAMHLRRIDREVPIILHTGGAAPSAEELALFNSFVSKGARLSAMLAAIEGALLERVRG
jgi:CheY-like chemotaxis protein